MRRLMCAWCAFFLMLLSLAGCASDAGAAEYTFFAMDTFVTVRISTQTSDGASISAARQKELFSKTEAMLSEMENVFSRTRDNSDTTRLNESQAGISDVSAQFSALLSYALELAADTDGAFSPTLGQLSTLWNITGGGAVPTEEQRTAALVHTDYRTLSVDGAAVTKTDADVQLDLGGIAKGYAVEQLCTFLQSENIAWGLVSLGGNIGVFGEKPDKTEYRIGLTDPRDTSSVAGYWRIADGYIAVSGDYERYFEEDGVRYHHIFDSKTGAPADSGLCCVAVHAADGATADALSTALFVMGAEEALRYYAEHPGMFEAVLFTADYKIICTPGIVSSGCFSAADSAFQLDM